MFPPFSSTVSPPPIRCPLMTSWSTSAATLLSPAPSRASLILDTENKGDINGDGKVSYIMIQGDPENIDAQLRTEYSRQGSDRCRR